ncbi:hypothetical protein [Flavobacterium sp. I3-2]|uniref:hypothetical protein n=1 Tax=Flavobacterium sp. I3-2 TaxID=2748319 RepID=UPI0015B13E90|nr:hypothetical protein [Flavobacterium sp. I3-2]
MVKTDLEKFVKDYIEAWSTTNADERKQLIEKVYSSSAEFYADEPGDKAVKHHGLENIYENIMQVNEKLVVGNGLITESTGFSENHDTLRVTWQMKTPDGNIAIKGMNFLQLDNSKKIKRDYIFIN